VCGRGRRSRSSENEKHHEKGGRGGYRWLVLMQVPPQSTNTKTEGMNIHKMLSHVIYGGLVAFDTELKECLPSNRHHFSLKIGLSRDKIAHQPPTIQKPSTKTSMGRTCTPHGNVWLQLRVKQERISKRHMPFKGLLTPTLRRKMRRLPLGLWDVFDRGRDLKTWRSRTLICKRVYIQAGKNEWLRTHTSQRAFSKSTGLLFAELPACSSEVVCLRGRMAWEKKQNISVRSCVLLLVCTLGPHNLHGLPWPHDPTRVAGPCCQHTHTRPFVIVSPPLAHNIKLINNNETFVVVRTARKGDLCESQANHVEGTEAQIEKAMSKNAHFQPSRSNAFVCFSQSSTLVA